MGAARAGRTLVVVTAAGLVALPGPGLHPAAAGPPEPEASPLLVRAGPPAPSPADPELLRGREPEPGPIPLVEPRGPEPVPIPLVEPREPGPVPMPRLEGGLLVDVDELTPRRSR